MKKMSARERRDFAARRAMIRLDDELLAKIREIRAKARQELDAGKISPDNFDGGNKAYQRIYRQIQRRRKTMNVVV